MSNASDNAPAPILKNFTCENFIIRYNTAGTKVRITLKDGSARTLPLIKKPRLVSGSGLITAMDCGDGCTEPKGTYLDIQAKYRRVVDAVTDGQPLRYSDLPDNIKNDIHNAVLSSTPYLHRFPGNWAGKEMLRRKCRNKRDTVANKQGRKKGTRRGCKKSSGSGNAKVQGNEQPEGNEQPKGDEQTKGDEQLEGAKGDQPLEGEAQDEDDNADDEEPPEGEEEPKGTSRSQAEVEHQIDNDGASVDAGGKGKEVDEDHEDDDDDFGSDDQFQPPADSDEEFDSDSDKELALKGAQADSLRTNTKPASSVKKPTAPKSKSTTASKPPATSKLPAASKPPTASKQVTKSTTTAKAQPAPATAPKRPAQDTPAGQPGSKKTKAAPQAGISRTDSWENELGQELQDLRAKAAAKEGKKRKKASDKASTPSGPPLDSEVSKPRKRPAIKPAPPLEESDLVAGSLPTDRPTAPPITTRVAKGEIIDEVEGGVSGPIPSRKSDRRKKKPVRY